MGNDSPWKDIPSLARQLSGLARRHRHAPQRRPRVHPYRSRSGTGRCGTGRRSTIPVPGGPGAATTGTRPARRPFSAPMTWQHALTGAAGNGQSGANPRGAVLNSAPSRRSDDTRAPAEPVSTKTGSRPLLDNLRVLERSDELDGMSAGHLVTSIAAGRPDCGPVRECPPGAVICPVRHAAGTSEFVSALGRGTCALGLCPDRRPPVRTRPQLPSS